MNYWHALETRDALAGTRFTRGKHIGKPFGYVAICDPGYAIYLRSRPSLSECFRIFLVYDYLRRVANAADTNNEEEVNASGVAG